MVNKIFLASSIDIHEDNELYFGQQWQEPLGICLFIIELPHVTGSHHQFLCTYIVSLGALLLVIGLTSVTH
jgi:hypothetical protein